MAIGSWEVRYSNSKQLPYFYNPATSQSMWERPSDMTEEEAQQLPGSELFGEVKREKIRASHILVKHKDCRNPKSWRQEGPITRSAQDATNIIKGYADELGARPSVETFSKIASHFSDCNSAKAGGDLGYFGHGQMQPAFEQAAFKLPIGGMSGPVHSDSGEHLILRTERPTKYDQLPSTSTRGPAIL